MSKQTTAIALPSQLRKTALAYPDKVQTALAQIASTDDALELLRAGDGWMQLMKDYGADTEAVNAIQRGRLYIQAKLGELMPAKTRQEAGARKGKGGKGGLPPFSKPTAARFRKIARSEAKIDDYFESASGDGEPVEMSTAGFINFVGSGGVIASRHNNGVGAVEWYTPAKYLDAARNALGAIDLDPASNNCAQKEVKAKRYYTAENNGLDKEWKGNVWLNPPYKMPLIRQFVGKLCEEFEAGNVTAAILLTNNSTDTKWWQNAAHVASALCFPAGRVQFLDDQGNPGAPLQGQALLYFGESPDAFTEEFGGIGFIP